MGALFDPICMVSSTKGASPPEMINWMHANFKIEDEKWNLIDDRKTTVWHAQGSIFLVQSSISFCQSLVDSHQFPLPEVVNVVGAPIISR